MPDSEKKLIKKLIAGDAATFEATFTQHYALMYSISCSIAGSSIADEVIQEAWISALRALPKFEGRSSLKSWLMRIVANEAKTRRRKESRSVSLEAMQQDWATDPRFDEKSHWASPSSQWHGDTPEALFVASELKGCIKKHMDKLPENQRVAMQLRDAGGMPMDEICNILEVSPSNLRVLLHRGRDKVLQVIDRFQQTGEC